MERITCFKLCYALGVDSTALDAGFQLESRISDLSQYFVRKDFVNKYRVLGAFFTSMLKNYYACADFDKFAEQAEVFKFLFKEYPDFDPVTWRGSNSLLEFLQELADEHNRIALKACEQLEIGMAPDVFELLTLLPELTSQSAAQYAFILSKITPACGVYFYGQELLNVAVQSMLQDDLSLRDRVYLLTGKRYNMLRDSSSLATDVYSYVCSVFVTPEALPSMVSNGKLCTYRSSVNEAISMHRVRQILARMDVHVADVVSASELVCGDVCITSDATWVSRNAPEYPQVKFAVTLPIDSRYYKQWRSRVVPNVYLISMKG